MKQLLVLPLILLGMHASSLAQTVLPGTDLEVRADTPIYVSPSDRGRIYAGHVARDVYTRDGELAIPRGSYGQFVVRQTGPDQFALDVDSVTVNGYRLPAYTIGPQFNMPRDPYDNGAGIIASILSSIVGEPGTETHVEVRGNELRVPSQAVIRVQLQQPLYVSTWNDPAYDRPSYDPRYRYR